MSWMLITIAFSPKYHIIWLAVPASTLLGQAWTKKYPSAHFKKPFHSSAIRSLLNSNCLLSCAASIQLFSQSHISTFLEVRHAHVDVEMRHFALKKLKRFNLQNRAKQKSIGKGSFYHRDSRWRCQVRQNGAIGIHNSPLIVFKHCSYKIYPQMTRYHDTIMAYTCCHSAGRVDEWKALESRQGVGIGDNSIKPLGQTSWCWCFAIHSFTHRLALKEYLPLFFIHEKKFVSSMFIYYTSINFFSLSQRDSLCVNTCELVENQDVIWIKI